jgi:ubiquitin C-terminal hydrolase
MNKSMRYNICRCYNCYRAIEDSLYQRSSYLGPIGMATSAVRSFDPQTRRRTDFNSPVGLRNLNNTCWMNSLLQVQQQIKYQH